MKIQLICVGKTASKPLVQLLSDYEKRLSHYVNFEVLILELPSKMKKRSESDQCDAEGEMILSKLTLGSPLILLDEKGKSYSSEKFARFIQGEMNKGLKQITFCIGGAFGFSEQVYQRATTQISLSEMTFTHQMVRLFFTEQLYRAFTILRGEKYHH